MSLTADYAPPPRTGVPSRSFSLDTKRRTLLLALVGVELVVLYAPTLRWLFDRWTISVWHNAHGLFVLPLVAWLVYQELRSHRTLPVEASAWGFALLVPALALSALDAGMHTELLSAIAFILALPALSLLFLGVARTKVILFPLCFSVFALPIPLGLTETAHLQLRHVAVAACSYVLPWLGITVLAEGTTLHTIRGSLLVADACSGFSTLYAAFAVACLTAYSAASPWRRVVVLAAAAPVAIASNILRVVLLVALVAWRGQGVLETPLHPLSGLMTFALALPIIFWLGGPARETRGAV
jgi:exosortase